MDVNEFIIQFMWQYSRNMVFSIGEGHRHFWKVW